MCIHCLKVNLMESAVDILSNFEANAKWLRENYETLKKDFNNEWVAVLNQAVIAHDSDLTKLVKRLKTRYSKDYNKVAVDYATAEELDLIL